jgi:hypothetical protein
MRNLLRRFTFIFLGLFALLLIQPTAVRTAFAGDDPGDDYGGYDDSWRYQDDCCCDDDGGEPKCCKSGSEGCRWGCDQEIGNCPPGTTQGRVTCWLYPAPVATSSAPMVPALEPNDQHELDMLAMDAANNHMLLYVRYYTCNGATHVASYHLTPSGIVPPSKPDKDFTECARPIVGDNGVIWWKPIDPVCGEPPLHYIE